MNIYNLLILLHNSLEMVKISQHAFDQIQFIKDHKYEQNESLTNLKKIKKIKNNSANTENAYWPNFFLYWPSFFILAEFVIGMMRADLAIQILY